MAIKYIIYSNCTNKIAAAPTTVITMRLIELGYRCCNNGFVRSLGARRFATASTSTVKVDKNDMMKLRKATGYSFINCRKALLEFGSDLEAAEKWLHDLAQKEGWEKAVKLSGKSARQGLIGVLTNGKTGAIVEVNCQTDFVASSDRFRSLTARIAAATLSLTEHQALNEIQLEDALTATINIDTENVLSQSDTEGQMKDALAFEIGKLGEKLSVTRTLALITKHNSNTTVFGYAHPKGVAQSSVLLGQFGTLVAVRALDAHPPSDLPVIGQNLCLHVVGMRPERVGTPPTTQQQESQQARNREADNETSNDDDVDAPITGTHLEQDQEELLKQQYIMSPEMTVHDYLNSQHVQCIHFVRAERGEKLEDE